MCFCFFACGKGTDTANGKANSEAAGQTVSAVENTVESAEKTEHEITGSTEINDSASVKPVTEKDISAANEPERELSQTAAPPTTKVTTTVPVGINCTVEIECKAILNKKNKFKKDLSIVPSDGVILSPVSVTLDENATAYDALKKACAQKGIAVSETKSSFGGVYITGIGGICEKDCGNQSGWVYTVNGKSPSVGLENYKLKNGDSVILSYVC